MNLSIFVWCVASHCWCVLEVMFGKNLRQVCLTELQQMFQNHAAQIFLISSVIRSKWFVLVFHHCQTPWIGEAPIRFMYELLMHHGSCWKALWRAKWKIWWLLPLMFFSWLNFHFLEIATRVKDACVNRIRTQEN